MAMMRRVTYVRSRSKPSAMKRRFFLDTSARSFFSDAPKPTHMAAARNRPGPPRLPPPPAPPAPSPQEKTGAVYCGDVGTAGSSAASISASGGSGAEPRAGHTRDSAADARPLA